MELVERVNMLLNGEKVDRVPFHNFILGFCARNVGYPVAAMYNDPEKSFQAQLWTLEQYGFDGSPDFGYASYGGWEFGGEIRFPASQWEQAPSIVRFPVQSEEDVSKLTLPDVKTAGMLPAAMRFSRLQEKAGAPISIVIGGNFTIAGNICPVDKLCRWMLKKPGLAHRLLQLASDHIVQVVKHWADTFGADRVLPKFWEPLSSNEIISPKLFAEFVFPYLALTSEKLLAMGV
ncbi:MAG: uroporphyrinogen decarboxylase family protein, partial [Chloroflexota bacterium]|nr:uroporphyrinogen decarboxylase family protein [Chloroflexota bacterium]